MIGEIISHYKILDKLGAGGMGEVYLAEDTELDRKVALKFFPAHYTADAEARSRFEREARAAAALNHPNIITVYEIGEHEGRAFIAMEYVEGESLRQKVSSGELTVDSAVDIATQTCDGLNAAHQAGIIHRDIKPENIILDRSGRVRILDFGLAKLKGGSALTREHSTLGTLHYMSPEQVQGMDVDEKSDIWSLGVVLYELLTNDVPFKGEYDQATIFSIINSNPLADDKTQSLIAPEIKQLLEKMLQKDPRLRYETVDQILTDLEHLKKTPDEAVKTGKHRLQNLWLPISLLLLVIISLLWHWRSGDKATIPESTPVVSIAVLPFINMSDRDENEYFSDGLSESIINALTKLEDLRVVARTSSFSFKGKDISIEEMGKRLHVQHILEGSVQKSGNNLRITAQLISTSNGFHLWSQQFDKELKDVFAIQDEIALAIVARLKLNLVPAEKEHLIRRYTDNIDAYNEYLKGHYYWNKRTKEGFEKSILYYEAAMEKDPGFVLPYTGLADVYAALGWYDFRDKKEVYDTSYYYARQALEIDDNNGQAHAAMGNYKAWCEFDWAAADREYRTALLLNPSDAEIHHQYAHLFEVRGKFDEALEEMQRAISLEPLTVNFNTCLGQIMFYAGQYEAADQVLRTSVEIDSTYFWSYYWQGRLNHANGELEIALELLDKSSSYPSIETMSLGTIGYIYARSGQDEKALKILDQMIHMTERRIVDPLHIAWIYIGLDDRENAFRFLDQAFEGLSSYLAMVNVDPIYDSLRHDGRFRLLLQKMGFDDGR